MRKRSQPPSSPVRWMAIISLLVAVATACGDDGDDERWQCRLHRRWIDGGGVG